MRVPSSGQPTLTSLPGHSVILTRPLFTFLDYDNVPWNNNNAEHAVRAFTRLRNVMITSTPKGTRETRPIDGSTDFAMPRHWLSGFPSIGEGRNPLLSRLRNEVELQVQRMAAIGRVLPVHGGPTNSGIGASPPFARTKSTDATPPRSCERSQDRSTTTSPPQSEPRAAQRCLAATNLTPILVRRWWNPRASCMLGRAGRLLVAGGSAQPALVMVVVRVAQFARYSLPPPLAGGVKGSPDRATDFTSSWPGRIGARVPVV
jgi:hypothetical protein